MLARWRAGQGRPSVSRPTVCGLLWPQPPVPDARAVPTRRPAARPAPAPPRRTRCSRNPWPRGGASSTAVPRVPDTVTLPLSGEHGENYEGDTRRGSAAAPRTRPRGPFAAGVSRAQPPRLRRGGLAGLVPQTPGCFSAMCTASPRTSLPATRAVLLPLVIPRLARFVLSPFSTLASVQSAEHPRAGVGRASFDRTPQVTRRFPRPTIRTRGVGNAGSAWSVPPTGQTHASLRSLPRHCPRHSRKCCLLRASYALCSAAFGAVAKVVLKACPSPSCRPGDPTLPRPPH